MAVGSFSAGLAGLNANGQYLSVIGNNLANINTVGFKTSAVSFMDLVSQTVGGTSYNPMQVGLGVVTGSISPVFSQGAIENTREATNVAIQGSGFFMVRGSSGTAYTRAGNFSQNNEGKLVTPDGYFVQGYSNVDATTGAILTSGAPGDLSIPPGVLRPPVSTTKIQTKTNLTAKATATDPPFEDTVEFIDTLGDSHVLTITYTRTANPGEWDYEVTVPGEDVTGPGVGGAAVADYSITTGTIVFDNFGQATTINGATPADVTLTMPDWFNGALTTDVIWDVVDDKTAEAYLTGFAADKSATSSKSQNGSKAGKVDNISISSDGTIIATFGAGQTVAVGQLALASFNNPKGLVKLGSSKFGESQAAGIANIGVAGTGGRGTLIGSALEQSNVDIAQEFTQMILAQRGYQANSKTITVSDELLVDTLNLKR